MNVDRNIPNELKNFWKVFSHLANRHQYSTVFMDFLDICIFNFSSDDPGFKENRDIAMRKYTKDEHKQFNELFFELIRVCENVFEDHQWYDLFGSLYESITSSSKAQGMGQFFTPAPVVDMMVKMQDIQPGSNVDDPACGSARFLIAAHVNTPGIYVCGQDLDLMCCKMSIINCFLHGCNAEIVWMNSLNLRDYKYGWAIRIHQTFHMPCIYPLQKENSLIWRVNQQILNDYLASKNEEKKSEIRVKYSDTLFPEIEPHKNPKSKTFIKQKSVSSTIEIQGELF